MSKRTFIIASAAAAAVICAPRATFADQPDWTQYKETFNVKFSGYAGTSTLTNFPALVRLSAERNGFDYAKCADGADLRFSDADGNLIPHEIDTWNAGGESLVWVQVPELTKTTVIKAYYGYKGAAGTLPAVTATDVWTNGYLAVWHMNAAEGKRSQPDATANGKTVTCPASCASGVQSGVGGKIGLAARCGLAEDKLGGYGISDEGFFNGFSNITVEAWTFRDAGAETLSETGTIVENSRLTGTWAPVWSMYEQKNSEKFGFWLYSDVITGGKWLTAPTTTPTQGEWHYHARRWSGETGVNSRTLDDATVSATDTTVPDKLRTVADSTLCIGSRATHRITVSGATANSPFHGIIDEVRVSNVFHSDDWVRATHDTVASDDFTVYEVDNDWKKYAHKFNISFPGATNDVIENFPVLVKISESSPAGFHYADCLKANGGDLRFADENGTLLPCEIEVWNPEGESLIWVKVPTLSSTTRITAYYGWVFAPKVVATDVWDESFVAVWHMDAASDSLVQRDATANKRNVSLNADYADNIVRGTNGVIGAAADFGHRADGKGNYGRSNSDGAFDGFTTATFEFWTKQEAATPNNSAYIIYCGQANPTVNGYMVYQNNKASTAAAYQNDVNGTSTYVWGGSAATPLDTWNHHAFRYDGVNGTVSYIQNNVSKHAPAATDANKHNIVAVEKDFCIGSFTTIYTPNANYIGTLDEMRISKVARSDAWIIATHDTIAENAAFTHYGAVGDNVNGAVIFFK